MLLLSSPEMALERRASEHVGHGRLPNPPRDLLVRGCTLGGGLPHPLPERSRGKRGPLEGTHKAAERVIAESRI